MKSDIKSSQQLKALFLYHEFVAKEMKNQGITMKQLSEHINIFPTKTVLHELFKDIHYEMHRKDTTRNMTREEMSNVLEVYQNALAHLDLHLEFPSSDKQSLLNYYS